MATSYGNNLNYIIITVESMPLSSALTGTVTVLNTNTAVVGVGTLFESEIGYSGFDLAKKNTPTLGYLYDYTNTEWRTITYVDSNTVLYIDKPFTNSLAGATVKFITASRLKMISWDDHSGAGGGKVNNLALAANEGSGVSGEDYRNTVVTPVLFDGTAGAIAVTISYV